MKEWNNHHLSFEFIKTNFDQEKFLVYNDNYHSGWQAFVNGRQVDLWRANYAFKGLWIPRGENIVYMRFGSLGIYFLKYFLMGIFYLTFGWLIALSVRR